MLAIFLSLLRSEAHSKPDTIVNGNITLALKENLWKFMTETECIGEIQ